MAQAPAAADLETPESRITLDTDSKAIRSWFDLSLESADNAGFDLSVQSADSAHFEPLEMARSMLQSSSKQLLSNVAVGQLHNARLLSNGSAYSARFVQHYKGVPVGGSEVVVNMSSVGTVYSIYNHCHYQIPQDLDPEKATVTESQAKELAEMLLKGYPKHQIDHQALIVYQYERSENGPPKGRGRDKRIAALKELCAKQLGPEQSVSTPKEGQYFLAWDIVATTQNPNNNWRILLDAMSGLLIKIVNLAQYATGSAKVFNPNPVVCSGNATLAPNTDASILDGFVDPVVVERLNAKDASGNFHLDGSFVQMAEFEAPIFAEVTSATANFTLSTADRGFLDAMCYYHIDTFQNYVQTVLGLSNVANFSIAVDPQGLNGEDNSHYLPSTKQVAFGEGGGVPDAQDAHVILHEYGHAIQDNVNPGFDNPRSGIGEGFGDFLSAVFYDDKHFKPAATRGWMMSWDGRGGWEGRRYDRSYNFNDPQYTGESDNHTTGEMWCTATFELYRKLGGDSQYLGSKHVARDLAIRLHLMANFHVPTKNATAAQMGQQIEAADGNLNGWAGLPDKLHQKVIYDTFRHRHLDGYPNKSVDVYINDGREGGYGSLSQKDLFTENLWLESYWETQDIWVKPTPYANAAAQAAGGPLDHMEPQVNNKTFLYTRVKNRGSSGTGSGPVKVRVFHASPGIGLVWPIDWTEMDASQVTQPTNIKPGVDKGVIVGPFTWTPTEVGHECVLAIVECANDRAVTQIIPSSSSLELSKLVPFDNNIAQRNLTPVPAKGSSKRGFWVRNPIKAQKTISLKFDANLPPGWVFKTSLAQSEVKLGPLDRVWVDVVIDQANGHEVVDFGRPNTLTVTGTIEETVIGGMTFYLAPGTAFEEQSH